MNYFQTWQVEKIAQLSEAEVEAKNTSGNKRIKAILVIETLKAQLKTLQHLSLNYNNE